MSTSPAPTSLPAANTTPSPLATSPPRPATPAPSTSLSPLPTSNSPSSPLATHYLPPPWSLSTGAIAGVFCLVIILYVLKKVTETFYHIPPPGVPQDDPVGFQLQHWQHNAPQSGNHVVTIPPEPSPPHATFTYEELSKATDGFSEANFLGQGGFGIVHKGKLPNGKEVAVKQLKEGSHQRDREFKAEVEIISRVHHKHLVTLVGYCIAGSHRILVYEFVPNNTLEFHLHGRESTNMDWPTRLKSALGAAKVKKKDKLEQ